MFPLSKKKLTDGRWDEQTTEKLPAHMKALLTSILDTTNKIEEELKLQKNRHAEVVKKLVSYSKRSH